MKYRIYRDVLMSEWIDYPDYLNCTDCDNCTEFELSDEEYFIIQLKFPILEYDNGSTAHDVFWIMPHENVSLRDMDKLIIQILKDSRIKNP